MLSPRSEQRVLLFGSSTSSSFGDAPRATPSVHRGGPRSGGLIRFAHPFGAAFGSLSHFVRLSLRRDPPPCRVPPKVSRSMFRCSGFSHRADQVGSPLVVECSGYALMSRRPRRLTLRAAFGSLSQAVPRPSARSKTKWRRSSAPPAPAKPAPIPKAFGIVTAFACHPRPEKSVRRQSRPVKKESLARR